MQGLQSHKNRSLLEVNEDFLTLYNAADCFLFNNNLFKIKRQSNHLARNPVDRLRELQVVGIEQVIALLFEHVERAERELQLGDKLEKGQIEVTTKAHLNHEIEFPKQQLLLFFHCKIPHRAHTGSHVWTVVIEALGCKFHMDGNCNICRFHRLFRRLATLLFTETDNVLSKVHCWNCAQRHIGVQPKVGKHANTETRIVGCNIGKPALAVLCNKAIVHKLHILHVRTDEEAIVQTAEIDIRLVLHLTLLRHRKQRQQQQQYVCNGSFHPKYNAKK